MFVLRNVPRGTPGALLALLALSPALVTAEAISGETTKIASGDVLETSYADPFVAWVDGNSADLLYYDERDDSTHNLGPGTQPAVGGAHIAFVCSSPPSGEPAGLCLYDPDTQQTTSLTSDPLASEPSLSSVLVAWTTFVAPQPGQSATPVVKVMELATHQIVSLPSNGTAGFPHVIGTLVVYEEAAGTGRMLYLYDFSTGSTQLVVSNAAGIAWWGFDGNHVVYGPGNGSQTSVADLSGNVIATVAGEGASISGEWAPIITADAGTTSLNLWRWTTGDLFSTNAPHPDGTGGPSATETFIEGTRIVWTNFNGSGVSDALYAFDFGAVPASSVSFSDNFNACTSTTNLGPNWSVVGTWYCKAGRARGESTPDLALANTVGMQNTGVSALVQLNADDKSGLAVRAQVDTYYAARLRSSNYVELIRVNGGNVQVLAAYPTTISQNVSYNLGLQVSGTDPVQLSVDLNGSQVLSYSDSSSASISGGFAGLLHGTGARTQYDNFVLSGSAPAFTPPPPPSGTVSFSDNFDACPNGAALDSNWVLHGDFYCEAQRARGEQSLGEAFVDTGPMTDTDVAALVQLDSNDGSGLVARAQVGTYYAERLRSSGAVDLVRVNNGVATVLASVAEPVASGTSYALELKVTGSNPVRISGNFAGATVLSAVDSSASQLTSGSAGILHGGGFRTQFDNFSLSGMTPTTP